MVTEDVAARVRSYIQHQATKSRGAILDLVSTSQGRYVDAIADVDEAAASKKPAPDEWSVRELTLHVISAQSSVATIVQHTSRGEKPPQSATEGRGTGSAKRDDGRPFAAMVEELRSVNATMLDAISSMPETPDLAITPPHPFFGPLNCNEWAVFQRVHDEDHVQHAGKILAAIA